MRVEHYSFMLQSTDYNPWVDARYSCELEGLLATSNGPQTWVKLFRDECSASEIVGIAFHGRFGFGRFHEIDKSKPFAVV